MEHLKTGGGKNVESVMEKYSDMVYRLATVRCGNRYDTDDIFQEVFLRLVTKAPDFENDEHAKAWLIRVTINCTKKLIAATWLKRRVPLDENISFTPKEKGDVYYAVLSLPINYRTVIHLFYYEGYSSKEIADMLSKNESTVKTWLSRARALLKTKLEGGFGDE